MLLKQHDKDYAKSLTDEMINNISAFPSLPLVRLKIDYSGGYSPININRFSEQFIDKIANYKTFLHFHEPKRSREAVPDKKGNKENEFKLCQP